jgi:hypothetical protein
VKPLRNLDSSAVTTVLVDIDDTLTTEGRLTAGAYAALEALHRAGKRVIPVTGRPAGWCDHIARLWPVDAVVGENGAFYFFMAEDRLQRRYQDGEAERAAKRERLKRISREILAAVPGCAAAADQAWRETDLAIDYCEDVPRLPRAAVDRIVAIMEGEGLTAKVSSIHVNGWIGRYDKLGMTRIFLREAFGIDLDAERERHVFAGDSPNDAPMFAFFPNAVGVANVSAFLDRIATPPAWITRRPAGEGFVELVDALLAP